jgi:hypothetical protein
MLYSDPYMIDVIAACIANCAQNGSVTTLLICKIWGFHGGDYEQCRFLGYKNPVLTSQDTIYLRYRAQPVEAM